MNSKRDKSGRKMGTPRTNKYRASEYVEGKYLICRVEDGTWSVFEMGAFDGEPLEYDPQCLTDIRGGFVTLREARAWCKAPSGPPVLSEKDISWLCGGKGSS